VAQKRAEWKLSQAGLDPGKLVFVDETWAKTNMTRLRGRAPVGERLVEPVPHGHWHTTTLIAALDASGMRCSTTVDGAVNRDVFEAFLEQVLCPRLVPGDVVVLDNLSSHKGTRAKALVEARGATLLFLPPYSPDLNPIELALQQAQATAALGRPPNHAGAGVGRATDARPHHRNGRGELHPPLWVHDTGEVGTL
jgi:transposase